MGYPERLLADNERIVFELRPHWRALILPVFWLVVIVGLGTFLLAKIGNWLGPDSGVVGASRAVVGVIAIFLLIFLTIRPILTWLSTHYVFTNRRLIVRTGIIARRGRDMPWSKVNDVIFEHSFVERIFSSGRLIIESAAENGTLEIVDVPDVERVQREVYRLHDEDDAFRAARAQMYEEQFRQGKIPLPLQGYVETEPGQDFDQYEASRVEAQRQMEQGNPASQRRASADASPAPLASEDDYTQVNLAPTHTAQSEHTQQPEHTQVFDQEQLPPTTGNLTPQPPSGDAGEPR